MDMKNDSSFKVVFVGESGVGKTSLINTYINGRFNSFAHPTISACCVKKDVDVGDETIPLAIWDTAGQEKFQSLIPMYLRGSSACIIVVDLSHAISLDQLIMYYDYLLEQLDPECFVTIFGNKCDLLSPNFNLAELKQWVKEKKISFYSVSAKDGTGVEAAFADIAIEIANRSQLHKTPSIVLNTDDTKSQKKCC